MPYGNNTPMSHKVEYSDYFSNKRERDQAGEAKSRNQINTGVN